MALYEVESTVILVILVMRGTREIGGDKGGETRGHASGSYAQHLTQALETAATRSISKKMTAGSQLHRKQQSILI